MRDDNPGAAPDTAPAATAPPAVLTIAAPPDPPARAGLSRLLPVLGAVLLLVGGVWVYRGTGGSGHSPVLWLLPAVLAVSTVLGAAGAGRAGDFDDARADYLDYLAGVRDRLAESAAAQRDRLLRAHPDPAALWQLIAPARWPTPPAPPGPPGRDSLRVGLGPVRAELTPVAEGADRPGRTDPATATARQALIGAYTELPGLPVTVSAPRPGGAGLLIDGEPAAARALLRALICRLAITGDPDRWCITAPAGDHPDWRWLNWLPQHRDTGHAGGVPVLQVLDGPRIGLAFTGAAGPPRRVRLNDPQLSPDALSVAGAQVCARLLAGAAARRPGPDFPALLGITDPAAPAGIDPDRLWRRGIGAGRLRVPLGTDPAGTPVWLDLTEAAEGGTGPHGLCIGATGSGKSELLRTVALGLLATHHPDELNLVLVDFKGGATVAGLARAPHVAGVITNLVDRAELVPRMAAALTGELHRRQRLLREAGDLPGIAAYTAARRAGAGLPVLPTLLVIVDEFAELLGAHPDFLDTFVTIGRLGRSLGVHLLLASQRLDEAALRGLDSHLSYRICLKTASAAESRLVLGADDAHRLPNRPGTGYLRDADGALRRFNAPLVSAPHARAAARVHRFGTAAPRSGAAAGADSLLDEVLAALAGRAVAARPVWLPPLADPPALAGLLAGTARQDAVVPIGVVDRPAEQCRTPLLVDLRGAGGHVAVVGAPRTGKSTALLTLACALAATHDATRIQLYCLDFGGGALAGLAGLAQVGSVAGPRQPDLVRRTVEELTALADAREAGVADRRGRVLLVVDGFERLCAEFDTLEPAIVALAGRGLAFGVHVVLSATRWAQLRPGLRDLIGTRIELRLGDPADSEFDRRAAAQVPVGRPGRGLTADGLHLLIATPDRPAAGDATAAAPPIPVLPDRADRTTLPVTAAVLLGVDERLQPVVVDPDIHRHLLIFGDAGAGKTAVLRLLIREWLRTNDAALLIVDPRGGLADVAAAGGARVEHAGAAGWPDALAGLTAAPAGRGQRYLVIDDYDLISAAAAPLAGLAEALPHAGVQGLHVVVARRSAGAARACYEPLPAGLRDAGAAGLLLSASPEEGPLFGSVRPGPLPPGRGRWITRDGPQLIQTAWSPP